MTPSQDLETFYGLLSELRSRVGGFRYLRDSTGRIIWPERGIYFFFDRDEPRRSGEELRVVRVGTHALRRGTQTTLWGRLHNHRGHEGGQASRWRQPPGLGLSIPCWCRDVDKIRRIA